MSSFTYVVNVIETFVYRKQQLQLFDCLFVMANDPSKQLSNKLFKLKLKGAIMLPILTVMIGVWVIGMLKYFSFEALIMIYFNCFMLLRSAQVYMIADGIRIKLEMINEDMMDLLETEKGKVTVDLMSVRARMEKIRTDYLCLKDLTIVFNDSDAWSLFCVILLFNSVLICNSYWLLLGLYKNIEMLEPYESICYIIATFLVLAIINQPCTLCLNLVGFLFL